MDLRQRLQHPRELKLSLPVCLILSITDLLLACEIWWHDIWHEANLQQRRKMGMIRQRQLLSLLQTDTACQLHEKTSISRQHLVTVYWSSWTSAYSSLLPLFHHRQSFRLRPSVYVFMVSIGSQAFI